MAVTFATGFEAQDAVTDTGNTFSGTAAYSTAQYRTGAASLRCNPASGVSGNAVYTGTSVSYPHFGLYVASLPTLNRYIAGTSIVGYMNLQLTSAGALAIYSGTTLIGTSSTKFASPGWHWVGIRNVTGTSVVFLQIDGVNEVTATGTVTTPSSCYLGVFGTEASAIDLYLDDVIFDSAGFLAPSSVGMAVPISDNAGGTGWTLGTGTALGGNGYKAVANKPPIGVADLTAGSDVKQIRNATANANVNYDANLQTYATAAPVVTTAKQGTVGVASNPVITNIALAAGGTSGAFWSGVAGGAYPTGWKVSMGTLTLAPSVTLGSSPVMRITQVTSSTLIAVVCFMGLLVVWTPVSVPYTNPMIPLLAM